MLAGPARYHWREYEGYYSQKSHKGQACRFETCRQLSGCSDPLCGRHGPRGAHPSSRPLRRRSTIKTGPGPHYSPTHWACCSYTTILARLDATVAMGQPTVHRKTSHIPPTEPTYGNSGRPSNGVRLGSDRPETNYCFSETPKRCFSWPCMRPYIPMRTSPPQEPASCAHLVPAHLKNPPFPLGTPPRRNA